MLAIAGEVAHSAVRAYVVTTSDLDEIDLPDELVVLGPRRVSVTVGFHEPEGSPWGQYVVLLAWRDTSKLAQTRSDTAVIAAR